ncbi:MFS transporter [Philodulcilactobacillus myokoensis]|uniref:MFS transporter n=1 Tax=Philodulcilactobacillus myokoensis TaxID=2929573 RepID=A0A9W6B1K6_9LACO|nr:MFS transporter [Philodulcilactobacillus myokoensis]GLB46439.1 MFS transporter [Philodulcilactobacillus myokoensis]
MDKHWRKNLWVLWFGTLIDGMAFSEVIPFLSLYVNQLGRYSKGELSILSGVVYAASFVIVAVTAPIWGRFADRHGRKRMVLQTSLGSAITLGLMGLVTNTWQLVLLRTIQGFFAGVIPNSTALVAAETPKKHAGYAMGIITTGYIGGTLVGPLLGGFLANIFSIRITFFITSAMLLFSFGLTFLMVKEDFHAPKKKQSLKSLFNFHLLRGFTNVRFIRWMLISTVIVQTGLFTIYPIISLFVKDLMHNHGPITEVAGLIAALPGMAMFLSSSTWGKINDRHGAYHTLVAGFILSAIFYFPQGLITSILILGILRFLVGISNAAIYPTIQTLIAKASPTSKTGMAFSLNQSAQAIGAVLGSLIGGIISNLFGYGGVFIFNTIILLINLLLLEWKVPELKKE